MISLFFNHVGAVPHCGQELRDSTAYFFRPERFAIFGVIAGSDVNQGRFPMALGPFVSGLSVVTAYVAFAFVGAIVLGVF